MTGSVFVFLQESGGPNRKQRGGQTNQRRMRRAAPCDTDLIMKVFEFPSGTSQKASVERSLHKKQNKSAALTSGVMSLTSQVDALAPE